MKPVKHLVQIFIIPGMSIFLLFAKTQVAKRISEYRFNPIGVDVQKSHVSWQTSYLSV